MLFVCTANSARSHLAAALWRRASTIPAASAGTRPATQIDPGAIATARRHHLPMRRLRPRHITDVRHDGDLVITVCDLAREELGQQATVHWSVPDPVPAGDPGSFDAALADLTDRVRRLAPRLAATSLPPGTPAPGMVPPPAARGRAATAAPPSAPPEGAARSRPAAGPDKQGVRVCYQARTGALASLGTLNGSPLR